MLVGVSLLESDTGRCICFVLDLTERKTLEEQLRQSQKMEAIGRLAGGVAHDFNNLLTAINGYAELSLMHLAQDDNIRQNIKQIRKAGERASLLTSQLLALSRKQIAQPKALNLNSVIADSEKILCRLIGEDVELHTVLSDNLGYIKADPGQIEQVIMNLAINARDAMPQGGKLTIETARTYLDEDYGSRHIDVGPGHYIMLAISDTGCGMDEETLRHMFEPFFTTKEKGKGTGLGLSIIYSIIKQSGGNIWVYSEVGKGATFKIYLPIIEDVSEAMHIQASHSEMLRGSETILLVEDEEAVRAMARNILDAIGYQVIEASNGSEALEICQRYEGTIHLMLTDLVMPRMSGRELAERTASLRDGMKVLYMSGYTNDVIIRHGAMESGIAFLQKPFTPYDLSCKLREALDR